MVPFRIVRTIQNARDFTRDTKLLQQAKTSSYKHDEKERHEDLFPTIYEYMFSRIWCRNFKPFQYQDQLKQDRSDGIDSFNDYPSWCVRTDIFFIIDDQREGLDPEGTFDNDMGDCGIWRSFLPNGYQILPDGSLIILGVKCSSREKLDWKLFP